MPKPTIVSPFKFRPPPTHLEPIQQLEGGRTRFDSNWLKWFVDIGAELPGAYRIHHYFVGKPTTNQYMLLHPFDGFVAFPNSFKGSIIGLGTPASAEMTLVLQVQRLGNPVLQTLGYFDFGAGDLFGTFRDLIGMEFHRGDLLEIVAPTSPDATAGNFFFNLVGTRG